MGTRILTLLDNEGKSPMVYLSLFQVKIMFSLPLYFHGDYESFLSYTKDICALEIDHCVKYKLSTLYHSNNHLQKSFLVLVQFKKFVIKLSF